MDKWNEICFLIGKHKEKDSSEDFFQNEIENIFEKLGWSRYKNEIISRQSIRLGAVNSVVPDIIIRNEKESILVVELKKPNQYSLSKHIEQLTSYMLLLKLNYGILIGDNLQLFYDDPSDKEKPIKIFETSFIENNQEGKEFFELISKPNFSFEKLQDFCDLKLELVTDRKIANELIEKLQSKDGVEKFQNYLREILLKDYNESIVSIVFENISVNFSKNNNEVSIYENKKSSLSSKTTDFRKYDKLPIEIFPSDAEEFKKQFIEVGVAKLCYHFSDGRVEEKIWKKRNFTETANLKSNLRSRPEARKEKWKQMGIVKLVCKIEKQ